MLRDLYFIATAVAAVAAATTVIAATCTPTLTSHERGSLLVAELLLPGAGRKSPSLDWLQSPPASFATAALAATTLAAVRTLATPRARAYAAATIIAGRCCSAQPSELEL